MPGKALLRTSLAVLACYSALGIFGILIPPLPASVVLMTLGYSVICSLATDFPKVFSFRRFGL